MAQLSAAEKSFVVVCGELLGLHFQPLKAELNRLEQRAQEQLPYEGKTDEEIQEMKAQELEKSIAANVEAANAELAEIMAARHPKKGQKDDETPKDEVPNPANEVVPILTL